jgi:uncharacterized protein (TIGR03643 family)
VVTFIRRTALPPRWTLSGSYPAFGYRIGNLFCPQSVSSLVRKPFIQVNQIKHLPSQMTGSFRYKVMELTPSNIDRIIQMAWEDLTAFDAIRSQFGLTSGEVIKLMRAEMKPSSFRLWRARTAGRKTKHVALRDVKVNRFRCPDQKGS